MEIIKMLTAKEWIITLLLTAVVSTIVIGAPKLELHIREKIKKRKIELDEKLSIEEKQAKIKELEIKTVKSNLFTMNRLGCLSVALIIGIIGVLVFVSYGLVYILMGLGLINVFQTIG